jgi:hypothetical protein
MADVRFWHKADIVTRPIHVCFWGQSGHRSGIPKCLLLTQSGHREWTPAGRVFDLDQSTKHDPAVEIMGCACKGVATLIAET